MVWRTTTRRFRPPTPTFASLLRAAGHGTGYFGNWDMGSQRDRPGFAEHASYVGQGRYTDASFLVNGVMTRTVGWVDDVSTDYAHRLHQLPGRTPFALVLGFKSPHGPLTPPPRLATLFQDAALNVPGNATSFAPYDPTPTPSVTSPANVRNYSRTIVGVDENIGRVFATLKAKELTRDTVVVFASDNGFFLDEHGIGLPAGTSGNNAPHTRSSSGYRCRFATPALALSRRPRPYSPQYRSRADNPGTRSVSPGRPPCRARASGMITGRSGAVRDRFLYEYFFEVDYEVPTLVAVQRGRYKLIRYRANPAWTELFDLTARSAGNTQSGDVRRCREHLSVHVGLAGPGHGGREVPGAELCRPRTDIVRPAVSETWPARRHRPTALPR